MINISNCWLGSREGCTLPLAIPTRILIYFQIYYNYDKYIKLLVGIARGVYTPPRDPNQQFDISQHPIRLSLKMLDF